MGEHGYPDPDTARMKRHIEPTDDSSFLSSPGRKRKAEKKAPPREVKTTVGRPAVNPRDLQPYEADPAEATPFIGSQALDSMPTSETDVASLQIRRMSGEATQPEIPVDVGDVEDTWEVETAEEPERVGGWPLVAGLIIGMVVAVGVGQVAVDDGEQYGSCSGATHTAATCTGGTLDGAGGGRAGGSCGHWGRRRHGFRPGERFIR